MTFRGFTARHRTAAGVLTPVALGVAVLITLAWALWSPAPRTIDAALTASTTECHDMVTISVAGRGDTPVAGTTKMLVDADGNELPAAMSNDFGSPHMQQVVNAPNGSVTPGSYAALYIAYPANMADYENAVTTGVTNTQSVMREIRVSCPNTKFSIVGYSEGADVARRVAMNIGHQEAGVDGGFGIVDPANVVGVVIIADAGRTAGQGAFPGSKNPFGNPDGFDTVYQDGKKPVSGAGVLPDTAGGFGALNGKIASFCSEGDLFCSAPQNISLLQLMVNVGRQLNVDAFEREGLTLATGQDVAVVLSRIALDAFAEIDSQPNWMQSDQTFLEVLLKVSSPSYTPGQPAATVTTAPTATLEPISAPTQADSIRTEDMSPLAYLPQKVLKEIIGLILTNQNTIPVIMSDPYQLTLAPGVGHHFDYWSDADAAAGKPLTSAEYAAAWLTYLAKQAQNGQAINPAARPGAAELVAALNELSTAVTPIPTTGPSATSTPSATTSETPSESAAPPASSPQTPAPSTLAPTTDLAGATETPTPGSPSTSIAPGTSAPATTTKVSTTTAVPSPAG
ncbi:cutinase family protein [Rhodococcus sp. ABRD24]|uniref:cutinase family protein n=1 Tax=Rhodococcus sp. ABRD24 TaxID=2507582 RepID=UPI00103FF254|nr:cutinase family protein [Rhodococcus sp. ABRD24]QBJ96336.1 cutinase family protein [Rhodococcus sp. ABRD24]